MSSDHFLLLAIVVVVVASTIPAVASTLIATSANLTKPGDSAILRCQADQSNVEVHFLRKGFDLVNDKTGKYTISGNSNNSVNKTLTINHVGEQDLGEYQCVTSSTTTPQESAYVFLYSKPIVPDLNIPKDLVEGQTLQLTCNAWGFPTPRCTWLGDNRVLTPADERVSFGDLLTSANASIVNAQLTIAKVKRSDQKDYTCSVTSDGDVATNVTSYVRVKDRLAAVWPSIGIVIVIVLTIIIIIFAERRRRKNEAKFHPQ